MTQDHHERLEIHEEARTLSDRSIGMAFAIAFGVLGLVPLLHGRGVRIWALLVATGFVSLGSLTPRTLRPLARAWTQVGAIANRVSTFVVMALVFYVTLTPIAVIRRLFGKDTLKLRFEPETLSYWITRSPRNPSRETMRDQF